MCFSRQSSGVMGNPDLQLRTDSLGLTPLLAPLSLLAPVRFTPQPQHALQSRKLPSSGGSGEGLPAMAVEVAAFDCSSSNDGSSSSMTGRHDSKLIGRHLLFTLRRDVCLLGDNLGILGSMAGAHAATFEQKEHSSK